jgi:hypothetical protein
MQNTLGNPKAAVDALDGVVARMRALNWTAFVSVAQAHRALALSNLGRPADALGMAGAVEARTSTVDVLLAAVYTTAGLLMVDRQLLNQARASLPRSEWVIARITEAQLSVADALVAGELSSALELLSDASQLAFMPALQVAIDAQLAPCLIATDHLEGARTVCLRLEEAAELLPSDNSRAAAAINRAALALAEGRPIATNTVTEAIRAAQASNSEVHQVDAAELLVVALARAGHADDADRVRVAIHEARVRCSYRWQWPYIANLMTQTDRLRTGAETADSGNATVSDNPLVDATAMALTNLSSTESLPPSWS